MTVKQKLISKNELGSFRLWFFGYEENGLRAKWGPGRRNFYIIQYVLHGRGYYNGHPVKKGQGFVMRPKELVEYHPDEENPWQYFFMIFNGDPSEEICHRYFCPDRDGIFTFDFRAALSEYVNTLFTKQNERGVMSAEEGLSAFYHVLSFHRPKGGVADGNRYVEEAKNYMHLNFHRSLAITEVAAAQNITDRYLYNLFIKHTGISPKQYLNEVRLQNAVRLLQTGDSTVTDVAISVGFPDVLTFSRFFAKRTGMSPTAYRKTHHADE